MSRLLRVLILLLATLPVVWGNCPGAFTGRCCCAPDEAGSVSAPCCPHCAAEDRAAPDAPAVPCSHCPCGMARDGSTPAPDPVAAPAVDLALVGPVATSAPVAVAARAPRRAAPRPSGQPPDLVGVVVLIV